ncbi:hypothetical protein [Rhodoblastus sp.]|uniref:hypothetical protein n=1 Tax=Rhodoblastus sp. TaxID=1962975 RepID=UPI0025CE7D84|nr:hypothetical protein [Rhodoblastus sp.]
MAFAAAHLLADIQLHAKDPEGKAELGSITGAGMSPIGLRPCDTPRPQFHVFAHAGDAHPFTIAGDSNNVATFWLDGIPALRNFADFLAALVVQLVRRREFRSSTEQPSADNICFILIFFTLMSPRLHSRL